MEHNTQLAVLVAESGLPSEQQDILTTQFADFFSQVAAWSDRAQALVITSEEQKPEMKQAGEGRKFLKSLRVKVENTRKDLKEESLKQGRAIDLIASRLKAAIEPIEAHLHEQETFAVRAAAQRKPGQRVAFNWRPLLDFTTAQVWAACGTSETNLKARQRLHSIGATTSAQAGWVGHPAYVLGNQRLSCALCVLGSKNDLLNGANHNPTTYGLYLELEVLGGSTFKHNQSLFDLPVSGRAAEVRNKVLARKEGGYL